VSGLRVVVAGAGAHVWMLHGPALEAIGAEVVAVQDVDKGKAAARAAELACTAASSLEDLLRHPADLAVVLTPHDSHAPIGLAALDAGLHVLIEKPLAVHDAEADALITASVERDRLVAVAFQQRTRSEVVAARELLDSGQLGELQRIDLLATWPRRSSYFTAAPWRGTASEAGGGILFNQAQHDLDLVCHLVGPPSCVTAKARAAVHEVEADDTAAALLEWESGALGSLHVSTAEADEAQRIEITGTGGRLRLLPGRLEVALNEPDFRAFAAAEGNPFDAPATAEQPALSASGGGTHLDVYRNLLAAIDHGEPLVAPAVEAADAVRLASAIVRSARRRGEVRLSTGVPAPAHGGRRSGRAAANTARGGSA
jgi:predicted dehydrogenase